MFAMIKSPFFRDRKATSPFPKLGLKLSYLLNDFVSLCGGRAALAGKITYEVNMEFQKKITGSLKLSFCDYINYQHPYHPAVGKATVFISHAWKYLFLDVLDALHNYFLSDPDVLIWFDAFSVNQHVVEEVELDFEWWSESFKSAIRDFGRTVMILAPWHDPVPLTRGWCLFEIYSTIITQSRFEVAMTTSSRETFMQDVISDPTGSINRMLATIDVKKSECSVTTDKERIFKIVDREVGFSNINIMIFERMRTWVIETTETARIDDPDNLGLMDSLATLYKDQGSYEKALPLYVACLSQRRISLGVDHPDTLLSVKHLAGLYFSQARHYERIDNNQEAGPLYVACKEHLISALGERHPDTLESCHNLGVFYYNSVHWSAISVLKKCLLEREVVLGVNHPETIETSSFFT